MARQYKKNYRRKKGSNLNYYVRNAASVARTASTAYKLGSMAMRALNSEVHVLDTVVSQNTSTTPAVTHLTACSQGDTDSSRTGDRIKIHGLHINGTITMNSTLTEQRVRVCIMKGNHEQGLAPSGAFVFGSSTPPITAHKDYDNRFETKIIYDRIFQLTSDRNQITFRKNFKVGSHVQFDNGSTTARDGGYYLMVWADDNTNTAFYGFNIRVRFVDN